MKNLKITLTALGISLLSTNAFTQDYVYKGVKNVEATIGMNNSKSDSGQETVSADCYDPANIGEIGTSQGCYGLLIVDNNILRDLVSGSTYTTTENESISSYADTAIFTGQVTGMSSLFRDKTGIENISNWDVSNVTDMSSMFNNSNFNQNINNWNVSNVKNMFDMFYNSSYNQPLNNWNVSKVTDMGRMFIGSNKFNQDISSWCVPLINSIPSYFDYNTGFEGQTGLQPNWGCN